MEVLCLYPKISLPILDELGLSYSVVSEDSNFFCTITFKASDFEQIYDIGLKGHSNLLKGGN